MQAIVLIPRIVVHRLTVVVHQNEEVEGKREEHDERVGQLEVEVGHARVAEYLELAHLDSLQILHDQELVVDLKELAHVKVLDDELVHVALDCLQLGPCRQKRGQVKDLMTLSEHVKLAGPHALRNV